MHTCSQWDSTYGDCCVGKFVLGLLGILFGLTRLNDYVSIQCVSKLELVKVAYTV